MIWPRNCRNVFAKDTELPAGKLLWSWVIVVRGKDVLLLISGSGALSSHPIARYYWESCRGCNTGWTLRRGTFALGCAQLWVAVLYVYQSRRIPRNRAVSISLLYRRGYKQGIHVHTNIRHPSRVHFCWFIWCVWRLCIVLKLMLILIRTQREYFHVPQLFIL